MSLTPPATLRLIVVGTLASVVLACGATSSGEPRVNPERRSTDSPNVAQQAMDPRHNDPTGGPPTRRTPPTQTSTSSMTPADVEALKAGYANRKPNEPSKIGARQVLIAWIGADRAASTVARSRAQALSQAQDVLRRLRAGEDFGRVALELSDDASTRRSGGSMGTLLRGEQPRAVEDAAFSLEKGQLSEIVESPLGFHVLQRTE